MPSCDITILALEPVDPLEVYDVINSAIGGTRKNKDPRTHFPGYHAHRNHVDQGLDALLTVFYNPDGRPVRANTELDKITYYASALLGFGGTENQEGVYNLARKIGGHLESKGIRWALYDPATGVVS